MAKIESDHKHAGKHAGSVHARRAPAPRKGPTEEVWTREDFHRDLRRATGKIEQAIRRDPAEVERLKQRLARVKEGEGNWGAEDHGTPSADTE